MSEKLTPAKRLKQFKQNGWLDFVEHMMAKGLSPRDLCNNPEYFRDFSITKTTSWIAEDIEHDLFSEHFNDANNYRMVGLSEQITPTKKNKMVRRGNYS